MAAYAMKVVDKSKEQMQHVDAALTKVRGQTWSEPLGKACYVTGAIVQGLGNFVPGLGIVGGALSLGGSLLNPMATMNKVHREQETECITCSQSPDRKVFARPESFCAYLQNWP